MLHVSARSVAVLLVSALPAQVAIQARTLYPVSAVAQATGTSQVVKSIAANTDVSSGFDLYSYTSTPGSPGCRGSGSAKLQIGPLYGGLNADLSTYGGGFTAWSCGGSGYGTAPGVLVTFVAPQPIAGQLIITAFPKNPIGYSSATAVVDVGNDGSRELTASGQQVHSVVVGPKGIPVLLGSSAAMAQLVATSSVAAVLFVPHSSEFAVVGTPCRGMSLEAYTAPGVLQFLGSGLPATGYALLNVGVQQLNVAIPPLGCRLYTDLLVPVGVPVNAAGETWLRVPVPTPVPLGTFRVQVLASDGNAWHTSNALTLTLR